MESVKKKILWFTHTNCGYDKLFKKEHDRPTTGTWIETIANAFKNQSEFELAVAFHSKSKDKARSKDNIKYYPIYLKTAKNKISRLMYKAKSHISWYDEIEDYTAIIENYKPDLIHVFGSEENFGFIAQFTRIPVVLSIQGNLTVYNWKYFSGLTKLQLFSSFNFGKFIRISTAYADYNLFRKKARREQEILKNIKFIIGRTDWDRRISKVLSPNSIYFYNDEILRRQFYLEPKLNPRLKETLIITTMTGPSVYKGLETVCRSVSILNGLGVKFEWNIGGVSQDENLVIAVKKKLGINFPKENINFLGRLNESEIINLLKKTNIYVMPSHIENSPLTLSEAMILGLPVVCTLAGGTSSRLTDKVEGILIQSGDPWSLSGAILEMKEDYKKSLEYGENARRRALARHDPERVINELKRIYVDIIKMKI